MKTLIDDLYNKLKELKLLSNRYDLMDLVFPCISDIRKISIDNIVRSDMYIRYRDNDFKAFSDYILDETSILKSMNFEDKSEIIRKNVIEDFLRHCIQNKNLAEIKTYIITLLSDTDIHKEKTFNDTLISRIETLEPIERCNNEIERKTLESWVEFFYYYFYYAVTDRLHIKLSLLLYPDLEHDIQEYNNEVTLMYGVSGNPGMYKLYSLAERSKPNIIALYECGELEYYGKGPTRTINHQKAYEYYKKTKECHFTHPLAAWSIAYMKYEYTDKKAKDSRYCVDSFNKDITNGYTNEWYESIWHDALLSYSYGCSAAANLLGKILDDKEKFPEELLNKLVNMSNIKGLTARELFKESADAGYVFGCNNYALKCFKISEQADNNDKTRIRKEAFEYLQKSVELGNPWAMNKMACHLYDGDKVENNIILEEDKEKAFDLFLKANELAIADNYYWPLINLVKKYWFKDLYKKNFKMNKTELKKSIKEALRFVEDEGQKKQLAEIREVL